MSNPVVVGVAGAVGTMLAGAGGYALGELHQLRDRLEIQQHTIDLLTCCARSRPSPEQRRSQFTLIQGNMRLGLLAAAMDWGARHARSLPAAVLGAAAALLAALVLLAYPHRAPAPDAAATPRPVPAGAPPSARQPSAAAAPGRPAPPRTPPAAAPPPPAAPGRPPAAAPAPRALAFAALSASPAPAGAPADTSPAPETGAASSASPAPSAGSSAARCPRLRVLRIVLCR